MKKTLALVMALLMVLSLVACGGGEQKDVIDTKTPSSEQAQTSLTSWQTRAVPSLCPLKAK